MSHGRRTERMTGNTQLLNLHKIGFLAPSHVAPLSVLLTLDWAVSTAVEAKISAAPSSRWSFI